MNVGYAGNAVTSRSPLYDDWELNLKSLDEAYKSELPDIAIEPPSLKKTERISGSKSGSRAYSPGDSDTFYVIEDIAASVTKDVQITATCLYEGTYCHVFFRDSLTGLPGIDAFTAHFVDKDEFSSPANSLYTGDVGIDPDATNSRWYPYPPGRLTAALHGPKTNFYSDFPRTIDVNLYDFGADYYEFVSGDSGELLFSLTNIADNTIVRAIHYYSTAWPAPHIDGSLSEWTGFTVTEADDAYHDNDCNNSGTHTGTYGQSSADMRKMKAFISSDILYLAIETETPPAAADEIDGYLVQLDVTGDSANDYQLNFTDDWLFLYALPSLTLLDLEINGVQYKEKNAVEIKIPSPFSRMH